ncbi:MAG: OmpA family protein [Myxococcales bacterium]|nr:OmpA family protein [Myxococcales bacterium]
MKKSMLVVAVAAALSAPALTGCTIKAGGGASAGSPPPAPPPATAEPAPAPAPTPEPAPAPAPAAPPKVNASTGQVEIPGNVVFDTGAATLKEGGGSEVVLEQVVQFMKDNPKVTKLRVEGHTDNVGQPADNEKLSGERALTVKRWLIEHGVDGARLVSVGCGQSRPIASNATEEGKAQNRRVQYQIAENRGRPFLGRPIDGGCKVFE